MTDLAKLIAAVEAVTIERHDLDSFVPVFGLSTEANLALDAYRGSMDAALALFNAMLPGWAIERITSWPGGSCTATLWGTHEGKDGERWHHQSDGRFDANALTPARALLLATLRALAAKGE